uniref:Heme haloperoxidase family profile domain-containing protein n=1 Tax=Passalora fulva TaxID=5499 RepID=A0A1P8YXX3_PASFU|nr:hypothetical protein 77 [Fulvia fulva]
MKSFVVSSLLLSGAAAFPFVVDQAGVNSEIVQAERQRVRRQQANPNGPGSAATCPFNANHVPAPGVKAPYLYNNAKNGAPGNGRGGYVVPDPNDAAHAFVAPGPNDIRGPCPGLNAAANHNFLAHDGITTFSELVDAQQNIYNVGYDLANVLALLGLTLTDGDLVTEKLSIGCDATTRTSFAPILTGSEPGLDGHNKFEADTSLTRNDYFTHNGDNFNFNGTLFGMMTETTGGLYNLENLAQYRYERYQQSKVDFGPLSLLLFGAASFLYELMPSGPDYIPDKATISSFFGAQDNSDGTYSFNNMEKIPDNWTNRVDPYDLTKVGSEILKMYLLKPVPFGGNTAAGTFNVINFGAIQNGTIDQAVGLDPKVGACLLYQLLTERVPSYLNGLITPSVDALSLIATKLSGTDFANLGCPQPLT